MDEMLTTVIQELRSLHGFGLISERHCIRCERYIRKHLSYLRVIDASAERIAEIVVDEA